MATCTHIKSLTFVDSDTNVLVVSPAEGRNFQRTASQWESQYQTEAETLCAFLRFVFCRTTLAALKKLL